MTVGQGKLLGSILLVAGTTIGAGMLALPVSTASAGFYPSVGLLLIVWFIMMASAFCFLELGLQMPEGTNLISMAERTLGLWGKVIAWWVYLALLYALNAAYLSSLSALVIGATQSFLHIDLATWIAAILLVVFFVGLLCWGIKQLDLLNRLLMAGLLVAFMILCIKVIPHGQSVNLHGGHIRYFWFALPVVVTSFGFHIILPSLRRYCGEQSLQILPKAILIGSALPMIIYLLWQYAMMSVVPSNHLIDILHTGQPAVELPKHLEALLGSAGIGQICSVLSFFTITTSFIGVSLSLFDFLFDGLKLERTRVNTFIIVVLTFIPPLAFTLFYPQGFVLALTYAGYFVSYLLIFMPALMVWRNRELVSSDHIGFRVMGGKLVLVLLMFFAVSVVLIKSISP